MSKLSLSVVKGYQSIAARKAVKKAARRAHVGTVRAKVMGGEDTLQRCACCLGRGAQSMHEDKPRSTFGGNVFKAVTVENSIPVCGSGTTGCHGFLQKKQIVTRIEQGTRVFELNPKYPSQAAAAHLERGWAMFDRSYGESDRPTHRMAAGL
jgi:hypothetical protein